MTVSTPELDLELANALYRARVGTTAMLKFVPKAAQTAALLTSINFDGTSTFPTGYTSWGGIGHAGPVAAIKSTSGAPADADFTGATPAISAPIVGSMIYNTNSHKLYIVDAASSYLSSVAFT